MGAAGPPGQSGVQGPEVFKCLLFDTFRVCTVSHLRGDTIKYRPDDTEKVYRLK